MASDFDLHTRQLRVFISSTFSDMSAERDALTLIFPQFKDICTSKGVEFIPVDLRWGITENEAKEGRVVETCLREIEQSRPFFIGIIGERYGWTPTIAELGAAAESLIRQYPWIAKAFDKGMSITEIEMEYGALAHTSDLGHKISAAFFIRRENADIPPQHREVKGSSADIKLKALKERIKAQCAFEVFEYETPEQLGEMVLGVLSSFLRKEFPKPAIKSYDNTAAQQEIILRMRSKSLFDLSRYDCEWEPRISDNNCKWLSITGIKGCGKSHLLAHVVSMLQNRPDKPHTIYYDCSNDSNGLHLEEFVFTEILHAIENSSRRESHRRKLAGYASSLSRNLLSIPAIYIRSLLRVLSGNSQKAGEYISEAIIKSIEDIQIGPIRKTYERLIKNLKKNTGQPVFVALDNLDALEEHIAIEIVNLLNTLPRVRFIVTASSASHIQSHIINILKARYMSVGKLSASQVQEYITNYLERFGKRLDEQGRQCGLLVKSNISGNPRLLSHVLSLMVGFGSHDELDCYIAKLAAVKNERQTYETLIQSISTQFSRREYSDTALKAIGALAASPKGLTEEEIIKIFSPTPMAWAMVRPYVLNLCERRGSELFISTPQIVRAIADTAPSYLHESRQMVIAYFENLHCHAPEKIRKNITLFSQLRVRQAQVLMPLYHAAGMIAELYDWATFIVGDIVMTDRQRYDYWQTLFNAGYNMRSAPDPNYPPDYKRGHITAKAEDINISSVDDLNDMYQRWSVIAGALNQREDSLWLTREVATRHDSTEQERFRIPTEAMALYTAKDFDRLIAIDSHRCADDYSRIFTDLYIGLAYYEKRDFHKANAVLTAALTTADKLNILNSPELIVPICIYSEAAYSMNRLEDCNKLIHVLESHYSSLLHKGLKNILLYRVSRCLTILYSEHGQYDNSLQTANIWKKSAIAIGTPDHEADIFIARIQANTNKETL